MARNFRAVHEETSRYRVIAELPESNKGFREWSVTVNGTKFFIKNSKGEVIHPSGSLGRRIVSAVVTEVDRRNKYVTTKGSDDVYDWTSNRTKRDMLVQARRRDPRR